MNDDMSMRLLGAKLAVLSLVVFGAFAASGQEARGVAAGFSTLAISMAIVARRERRSNPLFFLVLASIVAAHCLAIMSVDESHKTIRLVAAALTIPDFIACWWLLGRVNIKENVG